MKDDEDLTSFCVVVNHEEQYSVWPLDKTIPSGWAEVGIRGSKQACLAYIEDSVLRLRPSSLRKKLGPLVLFCVLLAGSAAAQPTAASVVAEVRAAVNAHDLARAEAIYAKHRENRGDAPEVLEALSWLARGALAEGDLDSADRRAAETLDRATALVGSRGVDAEPRLATAIGAGIEVQAQVLAARGQRSDAVYFLRRQLNTYKDTSIHKRIQKNVNLLSLEGTRAPGLDASEFLGAPPPALSDLTGKVLILFFWAHWCPDCKIEGPILADLLAKYQTQGLTVVAPTQRYGYVAAGAEAGPDEELRYIQQVRDTYYGFLAELPVPVSEANHKLYGVSSTPTVVLVDRKGIVRLYHPGRLTKEELEQELQPLLAAPR
ncbi:MAG: MbtH family NRPS accessory protein [Vicinamibacterales bacterium]